MTSESASCNKFNQSDLELVDYDLVYHWRDLKYKPKVIVFDLDHTLWPFYVDLDVSLPLRKETALTNNKSVIVDANGKQIEPFSESLKIIHTLKNYCFNHDDDEHHLAVASKALNSNISKQLLDTLEWTKYFSSIQVYSMSKVYHMFAIRDELKLNGLDDILFYDDNKHNIRETSQLGVFSYKIDKSVGINLNYVHHSLDLFDHHRHRHHRRHSLQNQSH